MESVFILFRHNFMFFRKSAQNTRESILQWVKDASSSSYVQFLVSISDGQLNGTRSVKKKCIDPILIKYLQKNIVYYL